MCCSHSFHFLLAQAEMMTLLENEDLARTPIIVLANKQDLKDAMQVRCMIILRYACMRAYKRHAHMCKSITSKT